MHAYLLAHPQLRHIVHGALTGLTGAILVDVKLFLSNNSWREFTSHWSLSIASYRWLQGAIGGAIGGPMVGNIL